MSALELDRITKQFGSVTACREVSMSVERGEIHGLLGENGAGKSTLMKILIGLVQPDSGTIHIGGHQVVVKDPVGAAAVGVAMAQQHFSLVEPLQVWENVALGHRGRVSRHQIIETVRGLSGRYGLHVDPEARIADLTVGQRQRVELLKCLSLEPQVLVLDEPTSVLTQKESEQLFEVLREVVATEGRAVVLISHKLGEILRATDRVTVMRAGRVVRTMDTPDADAPTLAHAMVGREVVLTRSREDTGEPQPPAADAPPALRLSGITVGGDGGPNPLRNFSIDVAAGEIVGLAGVEGNGQTTLEEVCSGLLAPDTGTIEVGGKRIEGGRASAVAAAGMAVIPEDRHRAGCVLSMSLVDNILAARLNDRRFGRFLLRRGPMETQARQVIEQFNVSTPSPWAPMQQLSGGNQQKVIVGRELSSQPTVVVACQPTRGLDVGAIEYIGDQLEEAARRGAGVLLVSSDLDELLGLSHRIVVISDGCNVGELPCPGTDMDRLGLLMGGSAA